MFRRLTIISVLTAAVSLPALSRAECAFLPDNPMPAWVGQVQGKSENVVFGVGSADGNGNSSGTRLIESARQAAIRNLTETVQVTVRSNLTLMETKKQTGSRIFTDSSMQSAIETAANLSMKNLRIDDPWLDRKTCTVWVRAFTDLQSIEQAQLEQYHRQLLATLKEWRERAAQENLPRDERLSAVRLASNLLGQINFKILPDISQSYYQQWVEDLRLKLESSQNKTEVAQQTLKEAEKRIDRARLEISEADRNKGLAKAAQQLRQLLIDYPQGEKNVFRPVDLQIRLAELDLERGNTCGARKQYMKLMDDPDPAIVDIGRKKARETPCSPADQEKSAWRQVFEGRDIDLVCVQRLNGKATFWSKACDTFANQIRPYGASVKIIAELPSTISIQALLQEGSPSASSSPTLYVLADGKIQKQNNRDNPSGGVDYQFTGQMAMLFSENQSLTFSDRFQGVTGWNPLSEQMAMDVLALNLGKRWKEKFSAYLGNRQ